MIRRAFLLATMLLAMIGSEPAVLGSESVVAGVDALTLVTEDYPPYNFLENGQVGGFSVDLLAAMLEHVGSRLTPADIRVLPWANAYNLARNAPNVVLFSTARNPAREEMFQWVGPIAPDVMVLLALRERELSGELDATLSGCLAGAVREDVGHLLLRQTGVSEANIDLSTDPEELVRKLLAGRIDLWAYDELAARRVFARMGLDNSRLRVVRALAASEVWFAVSRGTPQPVAAALQSALDAAKSRTADGGPSRYEQIMARYR